MRFLCPLCARTALGCSCYRGTVVTQTPSALPVVSLAYHEEPFQTLIHRLKYGAETHLADWLGAGLGQVCLPTRELSALVPVPLHPTRLVERGYNQAALLAVCASRWLGVPTRTTLARRVQETEAQARLGAKARRLNMTSAFEASPAERPMKVVIVDDVVTTGSTLEALKAALEAVGYQVMGALSVSVARPKSR